MTLTSNNQISTVIQADHVPGPTQGQWTYADYMSIAADGLRYEIINGVLYMPPAAGTSHQSANAMFITYLTMYVKLPGLGRVFGPPYDVELSSRNVVQPDVVVVLNANLGIINSLRIVGTPDLVVEIASPGTARYDRKQKLAAYQQAGVPEYWLADTSLQSVEILRLAQGVYQSVGVFQGQQTLPSLVVPNLPVQVNQFFS